MLNDAVDILLVDDDRDIIDQYLSILRPERLGENTRRIARRRRVRSLVGEIDLNGYSDEAQHECHIAADVAAAVGAAAVLRNQGRSFAVGFFGVSAPGDTTALECVQRVRTVMPFMHCAVVSGSTNRLAIDPSSVFAAPSEWLYLSRPFTEGELLDALTRLLAAWTRATIEKDTEAALGASLVEWF